MVALPCRAVLLIRGDCESEPSNLLVGVWCPDVAWILVPSCIDFFESGMSRYPPAGNSL